ncbi:MAG TPA: hypothetical protein VME47_04405 [Acetobacteraceae bacterium]|nr:hypothetical protein [Acetobacteraceae bacterium]
MGRSLVQSQHRRSNADMSGKIAEAAANTVVRKRCTGSVRGFSRRSRPSHVPELARLRAGVRGASPCSIAASALAWHDKVAPIAVPTLPVCPRESDATADKVRDRLHGLP